MSDADDGNGGNLFDPADVEVIKIRCVEGLLGAACLQKFFITHHFFKAIYCQ